MSVRLIRPRGPGLSPASRQNKCAGQAPERLLVELRKARLCLDCEDVHEEMRCTICGSDSFAYLSRWVPTPEGAQRPAREASPDVEVFQELLTAESNTSGNGSVLKRGLLGLTALGIAGWAWRTSRSAATKRES